MAPCDSVRQIPPPALPSTMVSGARGSIQRARQRPPTAFERYIASGRARAGLWRLFAGLGIIVLAWVAGTAGVLFFWTAWIALATGDPDFAQARLASALDGNDAEAVIVLLATFAGSVVGVTLIQMRRMSRATLIPLGTFLAAGGLVTLLVGEPLLAWYRELLLG